jgi:hypothetical protein
MTMTMLSDQTSEAPGKAEDQPRLGQPLLVYDGEHKCFPKYRSFWSDYYKTRARQPSNTAWVYSNIGPLGDIPESERLDHLVEMQARGNDIIDARSLEIFIKKTKARRVSALAPQLKKTAKAGAAAGNSTALAAVFQGLKVLRLVERSSTPISGGLTLASARIEFYAQRRLLWNDKKEGMLTQERFDEAVQKLQEAFGLEDE